MRCSGGKTFLYTGKPQVFRVPANVDSITVVMLDASGVSECSHSYAGRGGRVYAVIPVTPHQKLWIYVGGASDVRVAPGRRSDRILVAAGGGGYGISFGNTNHSDWGCPGYGGVLVGGDGLGGETYYGPGGGRHASSFLEKLENSRGQRSSTL